MKQSPFIVVLSLTIAFSFTVPFTSIQTKHKQRSQTVGWPAATAASISSKSMTHPLPRGGTDLMSKT